MAEPLETEKVDQPMRKRRLWPWLLAGAAGLLVVAGLVWLVIWSQGADDREADRANDSFSRYRTDWESAMQKVGVDATYPAGPVDLTAVRAVGSHPFSAELSSDEMSALLTVYRYQAQSLPGSTDIEGISVRFLSRSRAALDGRILYNGDAYQASAEATTLFADGEITLGTEDAELSIEGLPIGGQRRAEAISLIEGYLNEMLDAASGLEIEKAEIVEGGVRIEGTAPDRIEHPSPLPSNEPGADVADALTQ